MMPSLRCDRLPKCLVIGAGPAGVSAAIRLRANGHDVLLVEQAVFPREKVCGCCLNLAAITALAKIQCDQVVTRLTATTLSKWELRSGDRRVQASLPGGVAVSRWAMDAALADEAIDRGVQVRFGCAAKVIEVHDQFVSVSLRDSKSGDQGYQFAAVVFATGLSGGGVSQWLPFTQSPTGPLGVGITVDAIDEVEPQTIHIICGSAGYVGLVQLEDGRTDVAAAIRRTGFRGAHLDRHEIAARMNTLLQSAAMPAVAQADGLRMTPPLSRARKVGCGGLIAVGDAARYVEPFTGEGMAWAIESGIEAADCIADRFAASALQNSTLADDWTVRHRILSRRRQWICRLMSGALRSQAVASCLVPAIRMAPWAAKLTITHLNRIK